MTRRSLLLGMSAATAAAQTTPPLGPPPHKKGPKVYLDYDQVELDAAYDQTGYEPDIDQLSAKLHADSDTVRATLGPPGTASARPKVFGVQCP